MTHCANRCRPPARGSAVPAPNAPALGRALRAFGLAPGRGPDRRRGSCGRAGEWRGDGRGRRRRTGVERHGGRVRRAARPAVRPARRQVRARAATAGPSAALSGSGTASGTPAGLAARGARCRRWRLRARHADGDLARVDDRGGAGRLAAARRRRAGPRRAAACSAVAAATPSAGLGVPTTIQLPAGSCTRCAVSRDGIMPRLRAASARAGAACASSTSRSSASFCCSSA